MKVILALAVICTVLQASSSEELAESFNVLQDFQDDLDYSAPLTEQEREKRQVVVIPGGGGGRGFGGGGYGGGGYGGYGGYGGRPNYGGGGYGRPYNGGYGRPAVVVLRPGGYGR